MMIQEVIIENYLCYYGTKKFCFSPGLNIILGENGEGKTKFFEAIDWLFKDDVKHLEHLVSAKKLSEVGIGESFKVKISLVVKQKGEIYTLTRHFSVEKRGEDQCLTSNSEIQGIEETSNGERNIVDGNRLMESLFPVTIRKYSMFKGEAALDIFENAETLVALIQAFSDAKYYQKYESKGLFLRNAAESAVDVASRTASKNRTHYTKLEADISDLDKRINNTKTFHSFSQEEISNLTRNLESASQYVSNAEALRVANQRIANLRSKIDITNSRIDENYTTSLFDEKWILMGYECVHKEFVDKITLLSSTKRELQSQFDIKSGIKIGEQLAQSKLLNNSTPLPTTVPSKAIMEEMLEAQVCKVCNREALKGSYAYTFMFNRLQEYLNSQMPIILDDDEAKVLFENDYTSRLSSLATSHEDSLVTVREIEGNITEFFRFNEKMRAEINKLTSSLEIEVQERTKILGTSSIGEESLEDVLKNYNGWQTDRQKKVLEEISYQNTLTSLAEELTTKKREKDNLDSQNANTFLIKTRNILIDIFTIFKDTKETKFDEFVSLLQSLSNQYFAKINVASFTGTIVIKRKIENKRDIISIGLEESGRTLFKPNQSLLTSMHISVLFAISQLASEKDEESYPMIFDAPTSSFGETKTGSFLNIINSTGTQIILLSKDYIMHDPKSDKLSIKPEFLEISKDRAFWVRLERPFDSQVLKTINSEVIIL